MATKLTPIQSAAKLLGADQFENVDEALDALLFAIDQGPSECPCSTCRARSSKRAEYRARPDVIAKRKARAAARRKAAKTIEPVELDVVDGTEAQAEEHAALEAEIDAVGIGSPEGQEALASAAITAKEARRAYDRERKRLAREQAKAAATA